MNDLDPNQESQLRLLSFTNDFLIDCAKRLHSTKWQT
jgi:hypothetical protein